VPLTRFDAFEESGIPDHVRKDRIATPRWLVAAVRCMVLVLAAGCAGAADDRAAIVASGDTVGFTCLNALAPHVVSCHGAISVFPLTVTVDHARVLSDIELEVLTGDLDQLTVIDSNVTDGSRLLDDVGVTVLDAYLDDLDIELTRDDFTVCVAMSGTQVCK
jgi:hypothetical protein